MRSGAFSKDQDFEAQGELFLVKVSTFKISVALFKGQALDHTFLDTSLFLNQMTFQKFRRALFLFIGALFKFLAPSSFYDQPT